MSKNSSVTYKVNNTLNLRGKSLVEQKEEIVYANLALERSRLFLLCFFSQLPYLLANARYPISRITGRLSINSSYSRTPNPRYKTVG